MGGGGNIYPCLFGYPWPYLIILGYFKLPVMIPNRFTDTLKTKIKALRNVRPPRPISSYLIKLSEAILVYLGQSWDTWGYPSMSQAIKYQGAIRIGIAI